MVGYKTFPPDLAQLLYGVCVSLEINWPSSVYLFNRAKYVRSSDTSWSTYSRIDHLRTSTCTMVSYLPPWEAVQDLHSKYRSNPAKICATIINSIILATYTWKLEFILVPVCTIDHAAYAGPTRQCNKLPGITEYIYKIGNTYICALKYPNNHEVGINGLSKVSAPPLDVCGLLLTFIRSMRLFAIRLCARHDHRCNHCN